MYRMYVCRDAMDGNKRQIPKKAPELLKQAGVFFLNTAYFENEDGIFKVCNIKVK